MAPENGKDFTLVLEPGQDKCILARLNLSGEPIKLNLRSIIYLCDSALIAEAIEKGQGQVRAPEITIYLHQYPLGYIFVYENKSQNLVYNEEVKFKLRDLIVEGQKNITSPILVEISVRPGETKTIKLSFDTVGGFENKSPAILGV